MLPFLAITTLALAFLAFGIFALPVILVLGVLWLVTLPFRLLFGLLFGGLFRVVFGILGGLFSLILAPILLVVVGIALVGAFIAAIVALVTPLIPVVLLLLLGWGVYRLTIRASPALTKP
jgi:hypothetical protein